MSNCKNCNNHQNRQSRQRTTDEEKRTRLEIHIDTEEEYVRIPVDEYAALIADSTTLDIVLRWMKDRAKHAHEIAVILTMIGEGDE